MLKVEFHTHTSDDPVDRITHSVTDLIDRASALGYDAVAVTLPGRHLDLKPHASYAAERGIVLTPGVELTIKGKHVLLLNFERGADELQSFEELARLKRASNGVVVAPHPFYPMPTCLWS